METTELLETIAWGEDGRHQFKSNITNLDSLAQEIVAFSNSGGGHIFIGVDDDEIILGLSSQDINRLNNLISNVSSQYVKPLANP